ncbi:MAG TPA: hypothetical protein VGU69_01235 [Rhizomicrobium sp.]|nr:hypothetical protein [Rhizomicrobium sp.]
MIREPRPFYSHNDEKNFFRWLEEIPAVGKVTGTSKGLKIVVKTPVADKDLREIIAVMSRYSLDLHPLHALLTTENSDWFKNPEAFWHDAVFRQA